MITNNVNIQLMCWIRFQHCFYLHNSPWSLETNSFRMLQEVFIILCGFEVTYNGMMDCVFYCNSESLRNM